MTDRKSNHKQVLIKWINIVNTKSLIKIKLRFLPLTLVILVSFVIGTFGFGISLEPALSLSKGQLGQLEIRSIPKAQASMLRQLPLSARLTTSTGNNVTDGGYTMRFRLYDGATGGSVVWEETKTVSATSGVFSTLLGSVTSLDNVSFNRDDLYLGIKVGSDDEMTPRKRVAPSPSALNADKLDGLDTSLVAERLSFRLPMLLAI